jgi:hypothetical protein
MAKSRAQQAAIAISMKKAGKKPKSIPKAQRGATMDSLWKTAKVTPARMSTGYPEGMSKPKSKPVRMTERPKEMPSNIKNRKLTSDPVSGGIQYKTGGSTPAWQRKEGKSPSGGLNAKGRASLKAAGHDIKAPQPEGGPRKRSFCARMSGMKKKLTSAKTANDPNSRINKSLRKWNC